jgi:hypothetical protein
MEKEERNMITVTDAGKKALENYFKDRQITPLRIYMRAS